MNLETARIPTFTAARQRLVYTGLSGYRSNNGRVLYQIPWFTLSLGLPGPLDSPRVAAQSQIRPGRWTVHLVIGSEDELDGELLGWLEQARTFAERN